jgi:hypothetical protein
LAHLLYRRCAEGCSLFFVRSDKYTLGELTDSAVGALRLCFGIAETLAEQSALAHLQVRLQLRFA